MSARRTLLAASLLAAVPVVAAGPAFAAQGIYCQALDGSGAGLSLTLGAGPAHAVLFATLETAAGTRSTVPEGGDEPLAVAQAYLAREWFAVVLVDAETLEPIADARVLRVETGDGRVYQYGYLRLDGDVHPVGCEGP